MFDPKEEQDDISNIRRLSKGSTDEKIDAINLIFKPNRMSAEYQEILETLVDINQDNEVRLHLAKNFTLNSKGMMAKHYWNILTSLAKDPDPGVAYLASLELQKFSQLDNLIRELSEAQRRTLEDLKADSALNVVSESGKSFSHIIDNIGRELPQVKELITTTISYYPKSELSAIEKKAVIHGRTTADDLANRLSNCSTGAAQWEQYQGLCKDILLYCLVPPLHPPSEQSATQDGLHVRDLIFQIPSDLEGFWKWVLIKYGMAIIVECKNYAEPLKETQMITTAKYLDSEGLTSLGLILSRTGLHEHGRKAQENAWRKNKKMILSLTDSDLLKMLELKASDGEPWKVIDKAIRDFLTSLS